MAKFCRYCGRQLQDNEVCSCREGKAAVNTAENNTADKNIGEGNKITDKLAKLNSALTSGAESIKTAVKSDTQQKQASSNTADISAEKKERLNKLAQAVFQEQNVDELKYTNTIKRRISFTYIAAVIISLIVGFILCEICLDFLDPYGSVAGGGKLFVLVVIEIFVVGFGCRIADFLVARLGMQMEMSYNMNISRLYLKNIEDMLSKICYDENKEE